MIKQIVLGTILILMNSYCVFSQTTKKDTTYGICDLKSDRTSPGEILLVIIGGAIMSMTNRILICLGILVVDLGIFFFPLTAFFLIYILLYNPPWFREFLKDLDNKPDQI